MANQQWTITYKNEKGTTYELFRDKERQRMRTKEELLLYRDIETDIETDDYTYENEKGTTTNYIETMENYP